MAFLCGSTNCTLLHCRGSCAPPVPAWLMHKGLSMSRELARESKRMGWFQALGNTLLGKRADRLLVQTLSRKTKIIMPLYELVVAWYT